MVLKEEKRTLKMTSKVRRIYTKTKTFKFETEEEFEDFLTEKIKKASEEVISVSNSDFIFKVSSSNKVIEIKSETIWYKYTWE